MEEKTIIKISVRNLVEFVLRSGDLVSTFTGSSRNVDAIKVHQKIQKSAPKEYKSEVALSYTIEDEGIILEVGGRADGIIEEEDRIIIDEIKTTTVPLEFVEEDYNELHWAQAKCYGFIYSKENNLENICIQLTYYQMDTKEIKRFMKTFDFKELEEFFYSLVDQYMDWAKMQQSWVEERNRSIVEMLFPFKSYREGQRRLAVAVYKTIVEEKKIFAQAPTGIGKTLASLFPSIKAMGEGHTSKIFYLTAKTITRTAAEKAVEKMRNKGLRIKSLTITAKDKICFKEEKNCDPEKCEYARGHFDRVNEAIKDIFKEDNLCREIVEEYSRKHRVCPFEFSLELANFSDCIICDYNYVFDPRVYLKRFFLEGTTDFTFLIDEAHNLVDRAREMFSAELSKKEILKLKKDTLDKAKEVSRILNKINSEMIKFRKLCEENGGNAYIDKEPPKDIISLLREFSFHAEKWFLENKDSNENFKDELMEFYFNVLNFIRTFDGYDDTYVTYAEKLGDEVKLKLFCLDPSLLLQEGMKRGRASILFSATLMPMDYFVDILGGDENSYKIRLNSPFRRENLCLMMDSSIATTYKMRKFTYDKIVEDIERIFESKRGNYLVFFPSYEYMNEVYTRYSLKNPHVKTLCQSSFMMEEEREEFLNSFSKDNKEGLIGFAVMGGIFSEGIDLTGDRLIGTIIVGVGLPQISLERNIIKDYFNHKNNKGFEYAYMYPGMNKVMQAAGRVIRTEEDKGVVLLIDERFSYPSYYKLFPREWRNLILLKNSKEIDRIVKDFWNRNQGNIFK
ncbi:ATP-dependent DNA helicase [Clostridium colicanis]|uniref:Bifunctional ATP-dependent DNA helicase/DNA polymerase III subunit epsilon n=1 Tax=Clostridium colicanis DSM 13634 TaxID=1121305 RepID=A0A151AM94_9CLOT|nr:ATP-dependent DNA helicase [Clostridium colicanis]KYH28722.1 bifunctional ATP-dependent DNA helicase/DNA polymerase III subunit epsilon [Clostridium colicanis DSM 13634]